MNMNRLTKAVRAAVVVVAVATAPLTFAVDDTRGFLRGHAVDGEGHSLAGVTVVIKEVSTGVSRTVTTDSNGNYRMPALKAGTYAVVATSGGQEIAKQEELVVRLGGKTTWDIGSSTMEEMVITGSQAGAIDTSSAVRDFVVNTEELSSQIPLGRDLTSVAMLAPSTSAADNTFAVNNHDAPTIAISGASPAENACFINGLNVTNFRNGLGCSQVPFQFFNTVQIKNGGYSAEFGRAIGGVMNAITKSGANEFEGGVNVFYSPDSLREDSPNTYVQWNDEDERDSLSYDLWASGALIEDRLFFYALYSKEEIETTDAEVGKGFKRDWDSDFWALKLDFVIAEGHTLEYTGFDDSREEVETSFAYDRDDGGFGASGGDTSYFRGGENHTFKYTGVLNDMFTISAQYGINEYARTDSGELDGNPAIIDVRSGTAVDLGNFGALTPAQADDERKAYRIDLDVFWGDHSIRIGVDHETNTAEDTQGYSGGVYHRYFLVTDPTDKYVIDGSLNIGDEYVRVRERTAGGTFETVTSAFYIQDEWQLNDTMTLHFGLRNESFDNQNASGDTFIKIDDQWAPRMGFSWDPTGDSTSRVYGNFGRYYIPIAANTNIRMSGAELFTEEYYVLEGLNADDTPIFNTATNFDSQVFGDGTVPDTSEILDTNIDPMYQDEFILGYEMSLDNGWTVGVRGIYRELQSTIEDIAIDAAVSNRGLCEPDVCGGFHWYVLTNPGNDMTVTLDLDADGTLDGTYTFSADELGYPEATRKYRAVEFTFDREFDGVWMMGGSLVLSQTEGNHEGYVKSDNGQDDAGITTSFDQPGLTDGSNGYLPSDQRWALKVYGSYVFDNGISLGANFIAEDGRPKNCIGVHPTDDFAAAYGAESFYCGGVLTPRGSKGRSQDTYNLDLSAQYGFDFDNGSELVLQADIFNVLDFDTATELRDQGELGSGSVDPNYGKPMYYQNPRSVRLSARYRF